MTVDMGSESARKRFQRWFADSGLSQAEFAHLLSCDAAVISKLLSGERERVGLALAVAIEAKSGDWAHGPILPSEWVDARESAA